MSGTPDPAGNRSKDYRSVGETSIPALEDSKLRMTVLGEVEPDAGGGPEG